ncbi:type II restriction endonuclease subunit M [Delftia acidovorans]|uniref:type II restriction endonuclease subunit M n=1 Tax=Delftia acidovorans TaxID=80866 RepID=UPI000BC35269|nr:type II restriction endonuclease subunit M [Delftia acidovorans]ATH14331.1 type II restriction endonuclease subunit M [Delftia acidovorans]
MSSFLRLLGESDKASALVTTCAKLRRAEADSRIFEVDPSVFNAIPGKPFAYWISEKIRQIFSSPTTVGSDGRTAWVGLQTNNDFQWLRLWWESHDIDSDLFALVPHPKGGSFSKFYADVFLSIRWGKNGHLIKTWKSEEVRKGNITANNSKCWNEKDYFRPGLTWPLRTTGFSPRIMPAACIFGQKGPAAFVKNDNQEELLLLAAILNSKAFLYLVSAQLARTELSRSFEVGLIEQTPYPTMAREQAISLASLGLQSWSLQRTLDTIEETSHAFVLPAALRARLGEYNQSAIEKKLACIQAEIDAIVFGLYGFSEADRLAAHANQAKTTEGESGAGTDDDGDDDGNSAPADQTVSLSNWALGVAFGRFDWRLATGERAAPTEPNPFDPLPAKSPGMLPDGTTPFHTHAGILVDDPGHPHDLPRLVEEVLARLDAPVPGDQRRWLQKDFFPFHLQRYSKSRRKAPIYWPLSTPSGSYTLWVYYPSLSSQTLYTAINDFVEPKLKRVGDDVAALRTKGSGRTRDDEKQFEALQGLETELLELRHKLQEIAPHYKPSHDDGVQITAAPLWSLFRHKPWQKVLKDTWAKLEKGDYDWAHLAMAYWPERVHEKCKTDKSLAIAHGLEDLYVEPAAAPKKTRGRKKATDTE